VDFNKYIDHTILKPEASEADIRKLCAEALKYDFATAFVNPCWVELAASLLRGSDVNVGVAIGFPLGAHTTASKVFQTKEAIALGAQEPDMVINIGAIKSGNWDLVRADIAAVVEAAWENLGTTGLLKNPVSVVQLPVPADGTTRNPRIMCLLREAGFCPVRVKRPERGFFNSPTTPRFSRVSRQQRVQGMTLAERRSRKQ
jgi:hypothetical protein